MDFLKWFYSGDCNEIKVVDRNTKYDPGKPQKTIKQRFRNLRGWAPIKRAKTGTNDITNKV